jgi:addiction module RelE/StbE family toxin
MLQIIWNREAENDLAEIVEYLGNRNPRATFDLVREIKKRIARLPRNPYLYRVGRVAETRELVVHQNYIVVYQVTSDSIKMLSVLHARKQFL